MIRTLTADDTEQLFRLREVGFFQQLDSSNPEVIKAQNERLPYTRGYFVDETLASTVVFYPFSMHMGGQELAFSGIAGVMSAPEFRRKGHIKMLLKDGLEQLKAAKTGWTLLYAFDANYYAKYGWQSIPNGSYLSLPVGKLPEAKATESLRLDKENLSPLETIYEKWAKHYQFSFVRNHSGRESWQRLLKAFWDTRERKAYLLEDAYCIFDFHYGESRDPNRLVVHDYAYASPKGRETLLAFLAGFQGQADLVDLHLAANDPLYWQYASDYPRASNQMQARIVDVKSALEPLISFQDTSFLLQVHDPFCDWNHGTFRLIMDQGNLSVEPASGQADISLSISHLALLVSGTVSAQSAQMLGLFEGSLGAAKALSSLAAGFIPFMPRSDFF
ncbi:MAG: GNAT family N-acetyltransferase [Trueperaceae bacterium]|nr:GNAT family N-acetyltransferase [Trueperaceae bacterium]